MGLDDLFEFDGPAYAARLRGLSAPQLKACEQDKARKFVSSSCSLGIATGSLAATGGISAIWMGFAARNIDVASKKLDLIQAELQQRGAPIKDGLSGTDMTMAAVGGISSLVIGDAAGDYLEGSGGGGEGNAPGGDQRNTGNGGDEGDPSFGEVAFSNFAGSVAGGVSQELLQRFETTEWMDGVRGALGCTRLAGLWAGVNSVFCDSCEENIEAGLFARKYWSPFGLHVKALTIKTAANVPTIMISAAHVTM